MKINVSVQSVIETLSLETAEIVERSFLVSCTYGAEKERICEITDLRKIDWFECFEIPDVFMSAKQRKKLLEMLQVSVINAKHVQQFKVSKSGLYKVSKGLIYVIGNQIFLEKESENSEIQLIFDDKFKNDYTWEETISDLKQKADFKGKFISEDIAKMARYFWDVAPGCSEILFVATLVASIKPLLLDAGLKPYMNFGINLYGESRSFKSSLINAICSISTSSRLKGSYALSSKKEVVKNISDSTGFVYVLDDYHKQSTLYGKNKQMDVLNVCIRQEELVSHSGLLVTSAEYLEGIFSTQDRFLQIEVKSVDKEILTSLQKNKYYMGSIVKSFVEKIVSHYSEIKKCIPDIFKRYVFKEDLRASKYASVLMTVTELFVSYMCKSEEANRYLETMKIALQMQLQIQQKNISQLQLLGKDGGDIALFYKAMANSAWKFCPEYEYRQSPDEMCVTADKYLLLTTSALKHGMKNYIQTDMFKCSELTKHLREEGILCCDASKDNTKKITGIASRVLVLSLLALEKFCVLNFPEDEEIIRLYKQSF